MKKKLFCLLWLLCAVCLLGGCNEEMPPQDVARYSVTVLNGEHYSVVGDNRCEVIEGDSVTFEITLEEGYRLTGEWVGDACSTSSNLSWTQTVTFESVSMPMSVQLETEKIGTVVFSVNCDAEKGTVQADSSYGWASSDMVYENDEIRMVATPAPSQRFVCWSEGGYLQAGGVVVSTDTTFRYTVKDQDCELYANFASQKGNIICYWLGDGRELEQDCALLALVHPRANTLTGEGIEKDGHLLVGWQTVDGQYINLGSRIAVSETESIVLTAVWKEHTSADAFTVENGQITAYDAEKNATPEELVIPQSINGTEISSIASGAFEGASAVVLYLPHTVTEIQENAFLNCTSLTDVYLSDTVTEMTDASFTGCKNFETLHINAATAPRYMKSEYSVKADVYDRLVNSYGNGVKKIILIGGSSVQHGYNSALIREEWQRQTGEPCEVYNLGLNMAISTKAEYEMIAPYLSEGDIVLLAPEAVEPAWVAWRDTPSVLTGTPHSPVFTNNILLYVLESNWQLVEGLKVNEYNDMLTKFAAFNQGRMAQAETAYTDFYTSAYLTQYGDIVRPENGDPDYCPLSNGDYGFAGVPEAVITQAYEEVMKPLLERGVTVFVTFAPTNRNHFNRVYGENAANRIDQYTQLVQTALAGTDVEVLLTQADMIYNGERFSNSILHLGDPVRDTHTTKVLEAMLACLQEQGREE